MAKIGLFFGSDEGNTESIAYRIQERFGADTVEVKDIADATQMDFADYNVLIFGIPTWDFGQIQSDWEEFWGDISEVDFTDKTVAFFGLGDQFGYGDFFLDAMGLLHDVIKGNGAKVVGYWPVESYEFDASKALNEDKSAFVGLAIDEDQQSAQTAQRLNEWCRQLAEELDLGLQIAELND